MKYDLISPNKVKYELISPKILISSKDGKCGRERKVTVINTFGRERKMIVINPFIRFRKNRAGMKLKTLFKVQ